jgi:pilus assembly protein CpaB
MNSRRRRGVILLVVSLLCALAAFAGVLTLIRNVQSEVGPETTAYELKQNVPAHRALRAEQLTKVSVPERWVPSTAVTDLDELRGKTAANQLREGSLLQSDMLAERPALKPGQQEIAIMIDAETGVAGKIEAGSRVNIFATFEGEEQAGGRKAATPNTSQIIVSNAEVIDVGRLTPLKERGEQDERARQSERDGVPITFALSTEDAQRVAYAESFAEHVRLALVAPGDEREIPAEDRTYTLSEDE